MKKLLKIIGLLILAWGVIEGALFFYNFKYIQCTAGIDTQKVAAETCSYLDKL
mgnify:CR=1 FL=1